MIHLQPASSVVRVEAPQDLEQQPTAELDDVRGEERGAHLNFESLKEALEVEIPFDAQDLAEATRSVAERDAITADKADLEVATRDCETKAAEVEVAVNSRAEELEALAKARQVQR